MNRRMKYSLWALLLSISLIAGCGQLTPAGSDSNEKQKEERTPAQVLAKAIAATDNQTGLSLDTTMDQSMEIEADGEKESLDTKATMEIEMTQDPLAFSIKGSMDMMGESMPMEMYFADMTYYMKDPAMDEWGKMELPDSDQEMFEELLSQAGTEDPQEMLKQLEPFQDELTMSHENGTYLITLELDEKQSQKFKEVFIQDQLDQILDMMVDLDGEAEEVKNEMNELLDNIKIEHLKQTFHIDEKTFETKKVDQDLIMEMVIEGDQIKTSQKMSMDIKGSVESITVPEEVKNNAVDLGEIEGMMP